MPVKRQFGCGLANLGNTCFMSAYLQVLVRMPGVTVPLLQLPVRTSAPTALSSGPSAPSSLSTLGVDQEAAEIQLNDTVVVELQRLVARMLLSNLGSIAPTTLRKALLHKFQSGQHHDAQELGAYLLDCVQASRNQQPAAASTMAAAPGTTTTAADAPCPHDPPKISAFRFTMCTQVVCSECKNVSTTKVVSTNGNLILPVSNLAPPPAPARAPTAGEAAGGGGGGGIAGGLPTILGVPGEGGGRGDGEQGFAVQLEDLIRQVLAPETMTGEEQFHCEKCNKKQDAVQRSRFEVCACLRPGWLVRGVQGSGFWVSCLGLEVFRSVPGLMVSRQIARFQ